MYNQVNERNCLLNRSRDKIYFDALKALIGCQGLLG